MIWLRLLGESFAFAMEAISANRLRTILSLLGITIGIFAIISVFTVVDSMKNTIKSSIESLGDNVLFIQKWPWAFGGDYPWWKYMNRPVPKISELEDLQRRTKNAESMAFLVSVSKTVENRNSVIENASVVAVSNGYETVSSFEIEKGRFISDVEFGSGKQVAVIGNTIATNLFGDADPLNKQMKLLGRKVSVVGVYKKEGENMFGSNKDEEITVPVNFLRNLIDLDSRYIDPLIIVKAKKGISNEELRDELTGIMRSIRKLSPRAEDDFAINETSLLTKGFDELFVIVSLAGWVIGGFSILVGGFGIANIMFVSVRERTSIIGIQKSLGAKNFFILFQFLFEAIILSVFGGILGLLIIFLMLLLISGMSDFELSLTLANIIRGLSISATIGLVSGFVPAWVASRLDPVEAIRTNA
ncbi:MAG: ABC transporter permease [Bacteroidetes bacterium]|nr:ABC transporter permease [Bacteroidota bacterium]